MSIYTQQISGKHIKDYKDFDIQEWIETGIIVFMSLFGLWVCWIL